MPVTHDPIDRWKKAMRLRAGGLGSTLLSWDFVGLTVAIVRKLDRSYVLYRVGSPSRRRLKTPSDD